MCVVSIDTKRDDFGILQMGNLQVSLSTLQLNEDEIFESYNLGLELLQKSLALNPGNVRLRSMLRMLTADI